MTVEMRYISHLKVASLSIDCTPSGGWPKEADDFEDFEVFNILLACLASLRLAFVMLTSGLLLTNLTICGSIDKCSAALRLMKPFGLKTNGGFDLEKIGLVENFSFKRTKMKMTFDTPCVAVQEVTQILSGGGYENCISLSSLLEAQAADNVLREQVLLLYRCF